MLHLKLVRLVGVVVVLAGVPLLAASAQTQAPTPPSPGASPPATTPDATPMPPKAVAPRPADKSVTAPAPAAKVNALVGLAVFSSDGSKIGTVQSVKAGPDGSVKAIHIKTGGFLGLGGKLVAIPEGKFTKSGDNIQLGMTADEVGKLPEIKEQS